MLKIKPLKTDYGFDDLSQKHPLLDRNLIQQHYDKHYLIYINNVNTLASDFDGDLQALIISLHNKKRTFKEDKILFNALQVLNHEQYWNSMTHKNVTDIANQQLILDSFGNLEQFKNLILESCINRTGSGYCFVVRDSRQKGKLHILNTVDAGNPITEGLEVCLCIDVWEHSYYLNFREKKIDYVQSFFSVINWNFIDNF